MKKLSVVLLSIVLVAGTAFAQTDVQVQQDSTLGQDVKVEVGGGQGGGTSNLEIGDIKPKTSSEAVSFGLGGSVNVEGSKGRTFAPQQPFIGSPMGALFLGDRSALIPNIVNTPVCELVTWDEADLQEIKRSQKALEVGAIDSAWEILDRFFGGKNILQSKGFEFADTLVPVKGSRVIKPLMVISAEVSNTLTAKNRENQQMLMDLHFNLRGYVRANGSISLTTPSEYHGRTIDARLVNAQIKKKLLGRGLNVAVITTAHHYESRGQSSYAGLTIGGSGKDVGAGAGIGGLKVKSSARNWMSSNVTGYVYSPDEAVQALKAFQFWVNLTSPPRVPTNITDDVRNNFISPDEAMSGALKVWDVSSPGASTTDSSSEAVTPATMTEEELILLRKRQQEEGSSKEDVAEGKGKKWKVGFLPPQDEQDWDMKAVVRAMNKGR